MLLPKKHFWIFIFPLALPVTWTTIWSVLWDRSSAQVEWPPSTISKCVQRACLKCIRAFNPSEFKDVSMVMIDDGKRPLWWEASGEQMRSQISSLSVSFTLSPLRLAYSQQHTGAAHKQCISQQFYHFSPLSSSWRQSKKYRWKHIQGKRKKNPVRVWESLQGSCKDLNCRRN